MSNAPEIVIILALGVAVIAVAAMLAQGYFGRQWQQKRRARS